MLKNFLVSQNISFKEVNVETNQAAMQMVISKTGQMGVPQSEVNGKWILGFDPNGIMSALNH
jgi:glutaredoxin